MCPIDPRNTVVFRVSSDIDFTLKEKITSDGKRLNFFSRVIVAKTNSSGLECVSVLVRFLCKHLNLQAGDMTLGAHFAVLSRALVHFLPFRLFMTFLLF